MEKNINIKVNLDKGTLLSEILQSSNLEKEIDFVTNQLSKGRKTLNPIPIAKKYNLNYDSKLVKLLALFERELNNTI